ncbi:hypothetical protein DENSPDRAFT_584510 [Dentipellis sp. KUC8613]|nr:hypothetical protein DENSPDRAFT_584510 [Dentipellis sp. KUC8613]
MCMGWVGSGLILVLALVLEHIFNIFDALFDARRNARCSTRHRGTLCRILRAYQQPTAPFEDVRPETPTPNTHHSSSACAPLSDLHPARTSAPYPPYPLSSPLIPFPLVPKHRHSAPSTQAQRPCQCALRTMAIRDPHLASPSSPRR